mgnify:CR=1 FL=1
MSKMRFFALQELSNRKPLEVIAPSNKLSDYYGSHVFDRKKMQEYLPKEAYKAVTDAIEKGTPISREIADLIANGMKSWAKSLNVTHYTHWFQPLTDGTAEKHDGFIEFGEDGGVIERFSGKLLIQQEPDASSFPNGGIRNTFEARGYTAWDVSSPAFVVDTTLCIPTIFISYTGEALDYKTPLLKALAAVDKAATEVCQLFDKNITRVYTNLGWEQEYFLVDSSLYNARPDLCLTGRTLMGHSSAKDQQLEDHYFGSIPPRVTAFMKELEIECHKLGIPAKTRHNEVAPNQFELAPIFENCNLANDHNQLVMDLMKRIARKHHFNVLLHEKPYSGVNGSGKHNNWSLCTDTGINLFAPGKNPKGNMLFLTFLVNALMMVYKNQDLLRASIMSASNSYRLGANEAPPAILSCFLGSQLSSTLDEIVRQVGNEKMTPEEKTTLKLGIGRIPEILLDTTDRNRTSPFAFTGNRFEFRAAGSSSNCAASMIAINAAMANQLNEFRASVEKLMEEGIPFVIDGKQEFLPFIGYLLNNANERKLAPVHLISFLTQKMLLIAIYERWRDVKVSEAAEKLNVSRKSASRCFDELECLNIDVLGMKGKSRIITVPDDRKLFWEQIRNIFRNPVIKKFILSEDIKLDKRAGITALCEYSLLSDNNYPTYAVTKKEITASGIKNIRQADMSEEIGCVVLELGYFIDFDGKGLQDPLSVALSQTEDEQKEERVNISTKEMLEEYVWLRD